MGRDPRPLPENSTRWPSNLLRYSSLRSLQEVVDQLGTGVAHLDIERLNPIGEVVVHPHRRDSDEQTDGGGHQGLRNTAGDRAQTRGLLRRDALERVDDSYHRSEQSDERRSRPDSCQAANTALQFGVDDGFGALQ